MTVYDITISQCETPYYAVELLEKMRDGADKEFWVLRG